MARRNSPSLATNPWRVRRTAVNSRAGKRYSINSLPLLRGSRSRTKKRKLGFAKLTRGESNEEKSVSRYRPAGMRILRACPGRDEERCSRQTGRPRTEGRARFLERHWPQADGDGRGFSRG